MKKTKHLEDMEPVDFEIGKDALDPKSATCTKCSSRMLQKELDIELESGLYARLKGFECPKCKGQLLGLKEAAKLDRLMVLSRLSQDGFCLERSLSFDGDNYTLRIPKELTYIIHDKKIDIVPLSKSEFYGRIR